MGYPGKNIPKLSSKSRILSLNLTLVNDSVIKNSVAFSNNQYIFCYHWLMADTNSCSTICFMCNDFMLNIVDG